MMQQGLEYAYGSDVGTVRTNNEDFADMRDPGEARLRDARGTLFAVADGMGGLAAGEVASRLAVETLMETYYGARDGEPREALEKAFIEANRLIVERARKHIQETSMGTTLTAMALVKDRCWYAHVGDSRLYLLREGRLRSLTADHTLAMEQLRRGDISEEEARRSEHRSLLTRALGLQDELEVDVASVELQKGDVFLLCSDGLYNFLTADEIRERLIGTEPKDACARLIEAAKEKGSDDNITAQVIHVKADVESEGKARWFSLAPAVLISLFLVFLLSRLLAPGGPGTSQGSTPRTDAPRAMSAGFDCVDFALGKKRIYMLGLDRGGTRIVNAPLSGGKMEPFWYRAGEFAARPNCMALRTEGEMENLYFIFMGKSIFRNTEALPGVVLKDATCLAFDDIGAVLYVAQGKKESSIRTFTCTSEGLKEGDTFAEHLSGPVRRIVPAGAYVYVLDAEGIEKASKEERTFAPLMKSARISDVEADDFGRLYIAAVPNRQLIVTREGEDIDKATKVLLQVLPIRMALDGARNLWCLEKSVRGIVHPQPMGWIRQ